MNNQANKPLWQPMTAMIEQAQSTQFIQQINQRFDLSLSDFHDLYDWSIDNNEAFWSACWDFCQIQGDKGDVVKAPAEHFYHQRFFPHGQLNFAEHFLQNRSESVAMIFRGEDQVEQQITFAELYSQVSKLRQYLIEQGITSGDRVAGIMPNMIETVVAMLATTSLGAIWSSCSPDFGETGLLDRLGQVEPKLIIAANAYIYNGKIFDCREKIANVIAQLPSLQSVILVRYASDDMTLPHSRANAMALSVIDFREILNTYHDQEIDFERFPFNHPVYILFSSGTTGQPKCIVHCAGGVLLQHMKELKLHTDVKAGERLFYFTTCGWMMWNWLVSGLAVGATLCLYDGSPFIKNGEVLFDYIDDHQIHHFGVSAKYIDALDKIGFDASAHYNLSSLRSILSTGSPLSGHSFAYVYEKIKSNVCLSSIAGGTDIVSCFVLGSPTLPVYRGQVQTRGLGMAVAAFDNNGNEVYQQKGELVCIEPFPSMPIGFWGDQGDKKYHAAYFDRFDNIWCHGDYVEITVERGLVFHGRSDSTLNPGGVRIGTAEIYRQVEKIPQVLDSVVIGQRYDNDERVVLFVQLHTGQVLDDDLIKTIKQTIRQNTTPRHVPAKIIQVPEIPKTKSGKVVELAVRQTVHGEVVENLSALANPEALDAFKNHPELI